VRGHGCASDRPHDQLIARVYKELQLVVEERRVQAHKSVLVGQRDPGNHQRVAVVGLATLAAAAAFVATGRHEDDAVVSYLGRSAPAVAVSPATLTGGDPATELTSSHSNTRTATLLAVSSAGASRPPRT
jgi:hypothetical protein